MRTTRLQARLACVLVSAAALSACYPPVPPGEDFAPRWARTLSGPTNEDDIDGVAAGANGSVFVTGKFEHSASIGGTTLTSAGQADIPVARFDYFGRPVWVERFGGSGEDNLFDIDANGDGAVGTGWFEGTVDFGGIALTSTGASDCVIVALGNDGTVRWARAIGGPYRDGCNEVSIAADGAVVTSIDTEGGWTPPGGPAIPLLNASDTLLVRLAPDGQIQWTRRVGGDGSQRGKSLAVGPDGSIVFGGDSVGALDVSGTPLDVPGGQRDAWLSRWTPTGALEWTKSWGGPGDDIVKGLAHDGASVFAVGTFTGTVDVDGTTLSAGTAHDLAVVRFEPTGVLAWATSVTAAGALLGAEVVSAADGGILFGSSRLAGMQFRSVGGAPTVLDEHNGGTAWLAHYRPDGSVGFATTIGGTADGRAGEIARDGQRVYLDIVLRGAGNAVNGAPIPVVGKDSSVWAIDLATLAP